jgi:lipid-A-disaccharide synthase
MAVIFPFEEDIYRHEGVAVEYVGHPLLDALEETPGRPEARKLLGLPEDGTVVGLLPGSRRMEIERLLPMMLDAAAIISQKRPGVSFVLPVAPTLTEDYVRSFIKPNHPHIQLARGPESLAPLAMRSSDAVLVCSGTATLEAAILTTPMAVVYRTSALSYHLVKRLIRVGHISLPNLVAGREIVPELIQREATPERAAEEILKLLDDPGPQLAGLREVKAALGKRGAAKRAASMLLSILRPEPPKKMSPGEAA